MMTSRQYINAILILGVLTIGLATQARGQSQDQERIKSFQDSLVEAATSFLEGEHGDAVSRLNHCLKMAEEMSSVNSRKYALKCHELLPWVHCAASDFEAAREAWKKQSLKTLEANASAVLNQKYQQQQAKLIELAEIGLAETRKGKVLAQASQLLCISLFKQNPRQDSLHTLLDTIESVKSGIGNGTEIEGRLQMLVADHQFANQDFKASLQSYLKCRDLYEQLYGTGHLATMLPHYRAGRCHWQMQQMPEAGKFVREAADQTPIDYRDVDPAYAEFQLYGGRALANLGSINESILYHHRAIDAYQAALGPQSLQLAKTMASLSRVLTHLGNTREAMEYSRNARQILAAGPSDPAEADSFSDALKEATTALGDAYQGLQDHENALKCYVEYDALLDKNPDDPQWEFYKSNSLLAQALSLFHLKRFPEAETLVDEGMRLYISATRTDDVESGYLLPFYMVTKAQIQFGLEEYRKTLTTLSKAQVMMQKVQWGDAIVKSLISRLNGFCYQKLDDHKRACAEFERAIEYLWEHNRNQVHFLSAHDMIDFNRRLGDVLSAYVDSVDQADPEAMARLYRQAWLSKGSVSRVLKTQNQIVSGIESDSERSEMADWFANAHSRLSGSVLRFLAGNENLENDIVSLNFDIRRRREEALVKSGFSDEFTSGIPSDLMPVLKDEFALLDVLRLGDYGKEKEPFYVVFVVTSDESQLNVQLIRLADVTSIDTQIENFVSAFGVEFARGLETISRKPGKQKLARIYLENEVWKKIVPHLGQRRKIIVCPDGRFNWLPWHALRDEKDRFLLQDHLFVQATDSVSVCDLAVELETIEPQSMSLIGGLEYGESSQGDIRAKARGGIFGNWTALPYAENEIQQIQKVVPGGIRLTVHREINEQQFREQVQSASLLHVATHGFSCTDLVASEDDPKAELQQNWIERFPFAAHGLVLSNANSDFESADMDQMHTGLELMQMDMSQMELAVLSACHSAGGLATAGEGVFGLQKAFHLGGVKATIASRWEVDDENTATLMTRFYEIYFSNSSQGKAEALRQAQLEMIRNGMPVSDWASWSLTGDWR